MILPQRIDCLTRLGKYMEDGNSGWEDARKRAFSENAWFIPEFITLATRNIREKFLAKEALEDWAARYRLPTLAEHPAKIGIAMAANIPLVGFHDLLSVFLSGHNAVIKLSSRDQVLIKHLVDKLSEWQPEVKKIISFAEMLNNCDAYIATGSNNTSRYFEYYFGKYPHIIRRQKTSVGILNESNTSAELESLADDVYQFFGLGCRNVTKIYLPREYDFEPLLSCFRKYNYLADHHKYRNNLDYNLAIHILNKKFYMTNGSIILSEDRALFSPIGQLNYEFYEDADFLLSSLEQDPDVQCIVGKDLIPFGQAQSPGLSDYSDKTDTMAFLSSLLH